MPFVAEDGSADDRAAEYCRTAFLDPAWAEFPMLDAPNAHRESSIFHHSLAITKPLEIGFPLSTTIHAAWSLLVARMTGTEDVVFGTTISRESSPCTVPLRVLVGLNQTVASFLAHVRQRETEAALLGKLNLERIMKICPEAEQACQFRTLLEVINNLDDFDSQAVKELKENAQKYSLLSFQVGVDCISTTARFDATVIGPTSVKQLLERLEQVMRAICDGSTKDFIKDITMTSQHDLEEIWRRNAVVPESVNSCIHNLVEERVQKCPSALAIRSWDGDLSYAELDRLSTSLAAHLWKLNIGPGAIIPLSFEKSLYTVVAMLGVLKTGAAFVLLDTGLPEQRIRYIVTQSQSVTILCSPTSHEMVSKLAPNVIITDSPFLAKLGKESLEVPQISDPSSLMYVVYTSGSTGVPKGAMITHQNHASALAHQVRGLGIGAESKIYDFSAYSFDVSIFDTFAALTSGGCVCIPSNHQRQNQLAESITSLGADFVLLTPTVARQLSPASVPGLKTVAFIGESLHVRDIAPWWGKAKVVNFYGPSECTTGSTMNSTATSPEELTGIGMGAGLVTWIVDPQNPNILLPPGCVGELLLEGPLVGLGYLDDEEKTAEVFMKNQPWLLEGTGKFGGRSGTLYKTGDLVEYAADGTLKFIGRKDTQVKIRGNRVELGEIEHGVLKCAPWSQRVVAEIIASGPNKSSSEIAVFFENAGKSKSENGTGLDLKSFTLDSKANEHLVRTLQSHMIPTLFFKIDRLPMTLTGKIHRKRLRELAEDVSSKRAAELRSSGRPKRSPLTGPELRLQEVWSNVLEIHSDLIGLENNFFTLGGDSVRAMKMVSEMRQFGLELAVADVFNYLTLERIASKAKAITSDLVEHIPPFSLLDGVADPTNFTAELSLKHGLDPDTVRDAYPCTPLQEGLLSLSAKSGGDYIMQGVLKLSSAVKMEEFHRAWEEVFLATDILRTRVVQHDQLGLLQLVLDERMSWVQARGLDAYLKADRGHVMELGHPMSRYALVDDEEGNTKWFVWTIHHALFDGWSLSLVLDSLSQAYGQRSQQAVSYQSVLITD